MLSPTSVANSGIWEAAGVRLKTRNKIRSTKPINPNIMVRSSQEDYRLSPGYACAYSTDSISNPHALRRGSGMYFEFLLRRAPLAKTSRADVLVRLQFEFVNRLLKFSDGWNHQAIGLRFAPIRIAASFCHLLPTFPIRRIKCHPHDAKHPLNLPGAESGVWSTLLR